MRLRGFWARRSSALWLALALCTVHAEAAPEAKPGWSMLNPAQQQALAPLRQDWPLIDAQRKQKWLEVAGRFPSMPAEERARVQARMAEWARLSPTERSQARLQFQQAQVLSPQERQARWQEYQSLSPDERGKLAERAAPAAANGAQAAAAGVSTPEPAAGKRNVVQPAVLAPGKAVSPTVVQARPGATTTTMSTKPTPPLHHQAGLPKIAATAGFVDPTTLLPQRGPQGAAVAGVAGVVVSAASVSAAASAASVGESSAQP